MTVQPVDIALLDEGVRLRREGDGGPVVLLVPSGAVGAFDEDTAPAETLRAWSRAIADQGQQAWTWDCPQRADRSRPAGADERRERLRRLLLACHTLGPDRPVSAVATSLGAEALLTVLAWDHAPPLAWRSVTLCSHVPDRAWTVLPALSQLALVYGERDAIALVPDPAVLDGDTRSIEVRLPQEYAAESLSMLIVRPRCRTRTVFVPGAGHHLHGPAARDHVLSTLEPT